MYIWVKIKLLLYFFCGDLIFLKKRILTVGSLKVNTGETLALDTKIEETSESNGKNIELIQNERSYQVNAENGVNLLDAALKQGFPLDYKCKNGTCGKCTVKVFSGEDCLESATKLEKTKLKENITNGYRLACQSIIKCS